MTDFPERHTQDRIIALFTRKLGYEYLGNWRYRENNAPVEEKLLVAFLTKQGYAPEQITPAVHQLQQAARLQGRSLYDANKAVYEQLHYGVNVQTRADKNHDTVFPIDWENPENNHFALAEEVTLREGQERRPDLVLYLNGIAVAVMELKRSAVSLVDGIAQFISNQRPEYNPGFFTAAQWLMACNASEGVRYGTIGTQAKYYLAWKEETENKEDANLPLLDRHLKQLCNKARLIELLHDFILFDGGVKKLPRPHQYHAIKRAQEALRARTGGIIWHTQGSGKSLLMVMLARWILTHRPESRILVVTDRVELDEQIEGNFISAGQDNITRITSASRLLPALGQHENRLLCALIHKFATLSQRGDQSLKAYIEALRSQKNLAVGELIVFVDECHRSQSGDLYRAMKATMPNAVFIGFTGTPLIKTDKKTTRELFGNYIHVYKFDEAVQDGVVLDLLYEARDIDQRLSEKEKIDALFEARTKTLNSWQKAELKKRWGTMQNLLSAKSRMEKIIGEIAFDFETKPILQSGRGNALLVAAGIRDACKYYELFQDSPLRGKCGIVTSYNPQTKDAAEDMGDNTETGRQFVYRTYQKLLQDITPLPGKTKAETYEAQIKERFKKEPAALSVVIVVDKLLTGFDAVPCSYLYIDKHMQDHSLFQAICRTNRIAQDEVDWKDFGRIVDFKDLFRQMENAIGVYTAELDPAPDGSDPQIRLQNRLTACREKLDAARQTFQLLCEQVAPPQGEEENIRYFCGNPENPEALTETESRRLALYQSAVKLLRAYAAIADEITDAGYTPEEATQIAAETRRAGELRNMVRMAAGEYLDTRPFEADMRNLLDRYVEAAAPRTLSAFENLPFLEIVAQSGIRETIAKKFAKFQSKEAVAEAVENNVRRAITSEHAANPEFYERMSKLLTALVEQRRANALAYEEYLRRLEEQILRPLQRGYNDGIPAACDTKAKRALYQNLNNNEELALNLHEDLLEHCPHDWRQNRAKQKVVKQRLAQYVVSREEVERLYPIIEAQEEY
ncbi:MAG: type I restriction endonuclease subunit R [Alistipes senegalensis]|nr:type I restriction endonuclease subunit R [Oxalobacter formigenes]MCM1281546.1 type I restriction endonuclease subunit R [Alistipes senegalensis]